MKSRKEQLEIELAFENGAKIEYKRIDFHGGTWNDTGSPTFDWSFNDYRIKEEPKRIPLDGSDAFNLLGQKFKHKSDKNSYCLCVHANEDVVTLSDFEIQYEALSKYWLKWNELIKEWQPCTKIA